jgi:hypothetical protein
VAVSVGSVDSVVAVGVRVGATVGGIADGEGDAVRTGVSTAVVGWRIGAVGTIVFAGVGATGVVAQPRSSIKIKMAARIKATINLNRS